MVCTTVTDVARPRHKECEKDQQEKWLVSSLPRLFYLNQASTVTAHRNTAIIN